MKKIYIITNCEECPFVQVVDRFTYRCDKTSEKIPVYERKQAILETCPLPNATEEK
jgi:hypothetical protein